MLGSWRVWQSQTPRAHQVPSRSTCVGLRVAKGFRLGQRSRILCTLASMPSSSTLLRQTIRSDLPTVQIAHSYYIYINYINILLVILGNLAGTAQIQTNVFKSWGFLHKTYKTRVNGIGLNLVIMQFAHNIILYKKIWESVEQSQWMRSAKVPSQSWAIHFWSCKFIQYESLNHLTCVKQIF